MVLISTIAEDPVINEQSSSKQPQPATDPNTKPPAPYTEDAMRIAYIMRSYLSTRHAAAPGASTSDPPPPPGQVDWCRAMMEVALNEQSKWTISKLVMDHNHDLLPTTSNGGEVAAAPAVGMVFDSIQASKAFFDSYGERMGFKSRTGRGSDNMQRFLCWRGKYLMCKKKGKRGSYKKKDGDVVGVVGAEKSAEKGEAVKDAGPVEKGDGASGKEARKVPQVVNTAQSRLLRELGVRVFRYTSEERREIILNYVAKRNDRQVAGRPNKVPSKQALEARSQQGAEGSTREQRTSNGQVMIDGETNIDDATNGGEPKVGMVFRNEDKAYKFYVKYAGNVGFSVRKGWWDKSARNVTKSRVYVCSREGFRPASTTNDANKPRPETRTSCPARMTIKITTGGEYSVSEFIADHNHQLAAPLTDELLKSQRLVTKAHPEGRQRANLIPADYKNYLRSKRTRDMQMGDAGAILEYLQKMKGENPSFFYAIQVDEDDQLTNIFWADGKSIMDYYYFGDVLCFDTTYKANDYGRPFAQFIGVNHHKQIVFFAAAFLYDESIDSFKWLFETFKGAMCGKQPKTILTDQCTAKSDAVAAVWPGTVHRLCVWHIYQNATKYLSHVFQGFETFSHDFGACVYGCEEDEEEFLSLWKTMLQKYDLDGNEWLAKLYEEREKWALVYGREAFCADMKTTLQSEKLSSALMEYLNPETDLLQFFEHYEQIVREHRYAELEADYHASQGIPGIPPLPYLWQALNVYTPKIFELFRVQVELCMNCMIYSCGDASPVSEYQVIVRARNKRCFVRFDSSDGTVACSCKMFESLGIQCCHVLKVLDFNNIKELSPRFILKRWRKEAKAGSIRENRGSAIHGDPKALLPKRCSSLCRILYRIAAKAAENVEASAFLESQSDQILEQVERILQSRLLEQPTFQNLVQGEGANSNTGESEGVGWKRRDGSARRRRRSPPEMNKRQKKRKGQSIEREVAPRSNDLPVASNSILSHPTIPSQSVAPSQFMQGPTVQGSSDPAHRSIQGFHSMTNRIQESLTSGLQQQPFLGSGQASQTCPAAPGINSLQFAATLNPQLGHENTDQSHYSIPVWDFL